MKFTDDPTHANDTIRDGVRYEVACEAIAMAVALNTEAVELELKKGAPDLAQIQALDRERHELAKVRRSLVNHDLAGIAQVIEKYGPIIRAGLAITPASMTNQSREMEI